MKPTIWKRKTLNGKRVIGYRAGIGPVQAESTKDEGPAVAAERCENRVREELARLDTYPQPFMLHGIAVFVAPCLGGYHYGYAHDGSVRWGSGSPDLQNTIRMAREHIGQITWTPAVDDAAFLSTIGDEYATSNLRSWIVFQRKALYLRDVKGLTDVDRIHAIACDAPHVTAEDRALLAEYRT